MLIVRQAGWKKEFYMILYTIIPAAAELDAADILYISENLVHVPLEKFSRVCRINFRK